ncbi:MAG: hypothetical protein NTV49_14110 [Kiritimatiellaeota bacterium]|nr:hypothetical protein [Kiritimatiellota bacterium]
MKRLILFACVVLLSIILINTTASADGPVDTNTSKRTFTGSDISVALAYQQASAVLEAEVLVQGSMDLGAPGEVDYDGMRIKVIRNFKGELGGEIPVYISIKALPGLSESMPQKGDKVLVFLGGDGFATNQVHKLLPSTEANQVAIRNMKDRKNKKPHKTNYAAP